MSDLTHLLGTYVQLRTAQADPHAEGEVVGIYTEPTVIVQTTHGQVTWLARLVHETERPTAAQRCRTNGHTTEQVRVTNMAGDLVVDQLVCTCCGAVFVPKETP